MARGLKRFYGAGDLHYITFRLLSAPAAAGQRPASRFVSQGSRAGAAALPIRGDRLSGYAGTRSPAAQRTPAGHAFQGDAGSETRLCAPPAGPATATPPRPAATVSVRACPAPYLAGPLL